MKNQVKEKNGNDALMGLVVAVVGSIYLILSLMLKDASVGNPMEPKIFPFMIAGLLVVMGLYFVIRSGPGNITAGIANIKAAVKNDKAVYKTILFTSVNCIVYGLLFKRIGYVLSTVIFLQVMLYLTRGKKMLSNTIISVLFGAAIYITFSKMLGVTLPPIPLVNI